MMILTFRINSCMQNGTRNHIGSIRSSINKEISIPILMLISKVTTDPSIIAGTANRRTAKLSKFNIMHELNPEHVTSALIGLPGDTRKHWGGEC